MKFSDNIYSDNFNTHINLLTLNRIRLISLTIIWISPVFFVFDILLMMNNIEKGPAYFLLIARIIIFLSSLLYILFFNKIINNKFLILALPKSIIFLYILFSIFLLILDKTFRGDIQPYIILILLVAALQIQKPVYMLYIYGGNYIIFLIGTIIVSNTGAEVLTKSINGFGLMGISFLFSLYNYRIQMENHTGRIKLEKSEANFKWLFEINPFPVLITNFESGKVIECSEKARKLMKVRLNEISNLNIADFYMDEESRKQFVEELTLRGNIQSRIAKYRINGKMVWLFTNHEVMEYKGEKCIISGIVDITDIRKVEEELAQLASVDMMTGILNRRKGIEVISEMINCSHPACRSFSLCFIDLNELKYVNDTFGHNEGDNYIKSFCYLVGLELREEDYFFRMGGDEFIVLFMEKTIEEGEVLWKRILKGFDNWNRVKKDYNIVASHGFSYYSPGMNVTLDEIIGIADQQMYLEKTKYKEAKLRNRL